MSITYTAQAGTTFNTGCTAQLTLATQAQANGSDEVVVSDTLDNLAVTGMPASGNSYIGRKVTLNWGIHSEERVIVSDTAGTGTTRILGVNEPWVTPPATSDTLDIAIFGTFDTENGTASGGITVNNQTKEYTWTNDVTLASGAYVQFTGQERMGLPDPGSGAALFVAQSGSRLAVGYIQDERPVNGYAMVFAHGVSNGADGEDTFSIEDGAIASIFGLSANNPTYDLQWHVSSGTTDDPDKIFFKGFITRYMSYNPILAYGVYEDFEVTGSENANNYYEISAATTIKHWSMIDCAGFDTLASDTSTESPRIDEVLFINTAPLVTVRANKSWLVIDPAPSGWVVNPANQDAISFPVNTSNKLDKGYSIKATVQEADGTKLQNSLVNVYENTQLGDLVQELTTDVNGYAEGYFVHENYVYATATTLTLTTYGGHALQAGKWLYLPFVATQISTDFFDGTIVLNPDNNIVQTTQATAKTAGASVTWNDETNPSSIIKFTGGSGTLAATDTVTGGTSGADGVVTEFLDGDSTAGTIHLKTRDAIAFSGTETLSNGAGWTATLTVSSQQDFSIYIDAATLSYQALYDYLAAIQNETTLTATGELIWEWCRSAQTQPLYHTGSSFYTERSNSKGIIVVNAGAGSLDYFTDDAGGTYVPPTSTTLTITVQDKDTLAAIQNVQTSIHLKDSPFTALMNEDTTALGVASEPYTWTGDVDVVWKCRKSDDLDDPRYFADSGIETVTVNGLNITVQLEQNPFI